jgi:hypothetical protein
VHRYVLAGGKRSLFRELRTPDVSGAAPVRNVALARDGVAYAYQLQRMLSELYLVENLRRR